MEMAPKEYWVKCTFPEIKMYLFCLNIDGKMGWRLPTDAEPIWLKNVAGCWWTIEDIDDGWPKHNPSYLLIPVRDLKDD